MKIEPGNFLLDFALSATDGSVVNRRPGLLLAAAVSVATGALAPSFAGAQSLGGSFSSTSSPPVFSNPLRESGSSSGLLAQTPPVVIPDAGSRTNIQPTTILPTDTLPLPTLQNRMTFGENLQLRILQKLPSRLYFSGSCETSFRYETNPFQFPTRRKLSKQLPPPQIFQLLPIQTQQQIRDILKLSSNNDVVFRVLPNATVGWTITPHTRFFGNYFLIRDCLMENHRLNTTIQSVAYGLQQDIPIGSRANLQAEFQCRELYQSSQQPVFDFLPGLTLSYVATPRTVLFANALLQMRGKRYFQAPTKEIDPFYTWGGLYQRNGWTFSASTTFVQNFREPFRKNATIPVNNYSFICDFEIARRLFRQMPGLQFFCRAEPIYNFHSHNRPGLAGTDFRMFWGFRMAMSKPALTATLDQLRQQLEEQEVAPPPPNQKTKPSAYLAPHEVTAVGRPQPIHGFLPETAASEIAYGKSGGTHLASYKGKNSRPATNALIPKMPVVAQSSAPTGIARAPRLTLRKDGQYAIASSLDEGTADAPVSVVPAVATATQVPAPVTPASYRREQPMREFVVLAGQHDSGVQMKLIPPFPSVKDTKGKTVVPSGLKPALNVR